MSANRIETNLEGYEPVIVLGFTHLRYNPSKGTFINRMNRFVGSMINTGYMSISGRKPMLAHRLAYQNYHGEIPKGLVIDHIDDDKCNNRLDNLACVTQGENLRKCWQNRRRFTTRRNMAGVKATERATSETKTFTSIMKAAKHYGINPGIVHFVCNKLRASGRTKDGKVIAFEYL